MCKQSTLNNSNNTTDTTRNSVIADKPRDDLCKCNSWLGPHKTLLMCYHAELLLLLLSQAAWLRSTVKMETSDSYGKIWKFDLLWNLNPWTDCYKICHSWLCLRGKQTFIPSLVKNMFTGDFWANRWNVTFLWLLFIFFSEARAEIKPFDRFWRMMAQNARNHARMCLFGVKIFNFNIWPLFTPKISNFAPKIAISSQNDETWKSKYIWNY